MSIFQGEGMVYFTIKAHLIPAKKYEDTEERRTAERLKLHELGWKSFWTVPTEEELACCTSLPSQDLGEAEERAAFEESGSDRQEWQEHWQVDTPTHLIDG